MLILYIKIRERNITLVNVYGQNLENKRVKLYDKMNNWIIQKAATIDNIILGEDLKCCLNDTDRN